MARPIKNNCDYFPHDGSMRNHKKVKAIRSKFGITGYAIWNMILEYLTDNDGNVFENSEMELELMAGDFGVSVTEITDIVNYCIRLELLFDKNGFINSESLDENLSVVYTKRKKSKELSKKQLRVNGKYVTEMPNVTVVSVAEIPQSKVDNSKVKETIPAWLEFLDYSTFHKPNVSEESLKLKYESWKIDNWSVDRDGRKIKIQNWKKTILNTLPHLKIKEIKKTTMTEPKYTKF